MVNDDPRIYVKSVSEVVDGKKMTHWYPAWKCDGCNEFFEIGEQHDCKERQDVQRKEAKA